MSRRRASVEGVEAYGYIRVSKVGARGDDLVSPEIQREAIEAWARREGVRVVDWFVDLDESGRSFTRRKVGRMLDGIDRGDARLIVVWKWSRWARNNLEANVFLGKVAKAGGDVRAATEDFDTSTAVGKFSRQTMISLAELQSDQIGEGWQEAHDARRRRGLPHTAARRFGYTVSREDGYRVDESTRDLIVDAYARFGQGVPMRALVADWNRAGITTTTGRPWTATSLGRMLDTGFSAGLIRERSEPPTAANNHSTIGSFDVWREGSHEAIIAADVWATYKARREANAAKPRRAINGRHALSGLVVCGAEGCGRTMHAMVARGHNKNTWVCASAPLPRDHTMTSASNAKLEALVLAWVAEQATEAGDVEAEARRRMAARDRVETHVEALESRRARLVAKRQRVAALLADEDIDPDDAKAIRADVTAELESIDADLAAARLTAGTPRPGAALFESIPAMWESATGEERSRLLRQVIARIVIAPGGWADPAAKARIVPAWAE